MHSHNGSDPQHSITEVQVQSLYRALPNLARSRMARPYCKRGPLAALLTVTLHDDGEAQLGMLAHRPRLSSWQDLSAESAMDATMD